MFGLGKLQLIAIVVGLAVLVGVPTVAAYRAGATSTLEEAREETAKEIERADKRHELAMQTQVELTDTYRELAYNNFQKLSDDIKGIKVTETTITRNIYQERAANPDYYEQKMPEGGIKQWEESRNLLR